MASITAQNEKVRDEAFRLCREFLQGRWKEVTKNELSIRQISGGLSNLVFYVGLPDHLEAVDREPVQVLLRLFGELGNSPAYHYRLMTECVVFTILAERKLGPALHGVFPGGRLEQFIHGRPLSAADLRSTVYCDEIAKQLAMVHSLNVPISKEPTWLADNIRSLVSRIKRPIPEHLIPEERKAAEAIRLIDLRSEIEWMLGFLRNVQSPVVFSHNDVNCGNVLVREGQAADWDPVVLIDFEFAAYNYRGFDLANHFIEWMYDYAPKCFPYYKKDPKQYPSRSLIERWVTVYLDTYEEQQNLQQENNMGHKSTRIYANRKEQMDDIMDEIAAFSLATHILWAGWAVKQAQSSSITFAYYTYAYNRICDYMREKDEVIELFRRKKKGQKRVVESHMETESISTEL